MSWLNEIADKQTFGAAIVTDTINTMTGTASSVPAPVDKETFGAAVVTKTLDIMNTPAMGDSSVTGDYGVQRSVLDAVYSGKGALVNSKI